MLPISPQLINMIKSGGNPQQMLMGMLQKNQGDNPIIKNVINLANNQDAKGLEEVARNLAKSRNIDIDELYNQVTGMMK